MAPRYDLPSIYRTADWPPNPSDTLDFMDRDWSGAAIALHVRVKPGDTGAPLISLSKGAGITVTVADQDGRTVSRVLARFTQAQLDALPTAARADEPITLAYDIHVTPQGGASFVALEGDFIVHPGVTRP